MDFDDATNFVIALLIGILVGIEREKKKGELGGERDGAHSFGGIRTHVLLAELGAASAWLSADAAQPWIFIVTLAVTGAAVVASYVLQNRVAEEAPGLTSELAAIVVFLLGGMVVIGDRPLAVALAVVTSALLAYKQPLHGMVGRIDKDDMFAGIKLLIASFIVLPLLPDRTIDPWDAINPYKLWLLVIMISALSLAGYAAMRTLGTAHGTAVTGLTGGLVSSTAATLSFARAARFGASVADSHALAAGILLAWLMMFLRLLVTVGIVNRSLLAGLWLPLGAMAAIVAGFAVWHYRRGLADGKSSSRESVPVRNPFSLTSAMKFGALFAAVLLIVRIVELQAPAGGIYLVAALAGLVDVDAIALSLAVGPGEPAQAGLAIVIAAMSNTAVKCGMTVIYGSGRLRLWIPAATAAILAVGLATSLLNR